MKDVPKRAGRRSGRKAEQILRGARQVFLPEGFNDATVDDIAKMGEVSKATAPPIFPAFCLSGRGLHTDVNASRAS